MVPADALGFMGLEHLDADLRAALAGLPSDQRAALDQSGLRPAIDSLTGDLALELSKPPGAEPPAGALMVGTGDEQAMTAALEVAAKTLSEGLVTDGAPSSAWKTVTTAA